MSPRRNKQPPDFEMKVTQIYKNKPLDRQLSEAIQINSLSNQQRINSKLEYKHHKLPRTTLSWE